MKAAGVRASAGETGIQGFVDFLRAEGTRKNGIPARAGGGGTGVCVPCRRIDEGTGVCAMPVEPASSS